MPKLKPAKPPQVDRVDPNAVDVGRGLRTPPKSKVIYPDRDEVFLARGKAAGRASHSLGDGWQPEDAVVAEGPDVLQPNKLA